MAASFQILFAASLRRVRVRIDVVLEFVLTDVRRGEGKRLRQYVPLVGVRNGNQGIVSARSWWRVSLAIALCEEC